MANNRRAAKLLAFQRRPAVNRKLKLTIYRDSIVAYVEGEEWDRSFAVKDFTGGAEVDSVEVVDHSRQTLLEQFFGVEPPRRRRKRAR
jgi:hypothetical protein